MTTDTRARALLDALVRASSPPTDHAERSLELVEARIVADAELSAEPTPARPLRELLRFAAIAVAIAATMLLVVRGVVLGITALRTTPEPAAAASDVVGAPIPDRVQPSESTARVVVPAPTVAPSVDLPAEPEPASPPVSRPTRPRDAAPAATGVEAELALVRAAMDEADDRAALALLDRHADRFPRGVLAREREMIRAERLCALGRRDDARAVATRFLATGADDPLARRMRKVCIDP